MTDAERYVFELRAEAARLLELVQNPEFFCSQLTRGAIERTLWKNETARRVAVVAAAKAVSAANQILATVRAAEDCAEF